MIACKQAVFKAEKNAKNTENDSAGGAFVYCDTHESMVLYIENAQGNTAVRKQLNPSHRKVIFGGAV